MSISYFAEKIKPFYWLILFGAIASIFFALGRLSAIEERHEPIKILQSPESQTANAISATESSQSVGNVGSGTTENTTSAGTVIAGATATSASSPVAPGGQVIGSKTGKKYYFPWCGTVKRIKPENQVTFASVDLAKAAGYTPGGNCKGLQ